MENQCSSHELVASVYSSFQMHHEESCEHVKASPAEGANTPLCYFTSSAVFSVRLQKLGQNLQVQNLFWGILTNFVA